MEVTSGMTLGQALKASDLVSSGGEAKILVQAGEIKVNGEIETRRGRKLLSGDVIEVGEGFGRVEVS
ncbi:MAG: RNA-binding S4 domain-containing protein [Rubrobacter sp.]|nr:RNA-binding S4 domain-containing protein [Rubrobacter sp.]